MSHQAKRERIEAVLSFTFCGLHNVPGRIRHAAALSPWGNASASVCVSTDLATFDGERLTRLVVAAHDQAVRVEITGDGGPGRVRILLWTLDREGGRSRHHPTIERALDGMKGRAIWDPGPSEDPSQPAE